ncbi:TetR/AcrR family transcriptional regulator [Tyzzerella sp. OttesenSCG-928-J15]|nr:TetR/AcrR family transcriptional regulator [Tyzzerella sp. OttesenSCG-928-J15]
MPTKTFFRLRGDKQERIMRAAIQEFITNGFERAKISDIAKNSDIAKGSIYQYFEDKKELFIYCAQWGLEVFMEKLNQRININDMDIFEYFKDNVAKTYVIAEEIELVAFMQLIEREPGLSDPSMKAMYNVGDKYGKMLIENSRKKGIIRSDVDDELLMEYFLAVSERFKFRWIRKGYIDFTAETNMADKDAVNREMEQMLDLLKRGMGC